MERVYYADLYPTMAREFKSDYWAEDIKVKNIITLMFGKGSSDPNTPVYDARTGLWPKLKDFKEGPVASAYASDGKVFRAVGTDSFIEGSGRMYKVKTKLGREARVWEGHRYLAWGEERWENGASRSFKASGKPEWKRLWDLRPGDHIAHAAYVPEPTETVEFLDRDVELLGLLIGDGSVGRPHEVHSAVGTQAPKTLARTINLYGQFENTASVVKLDTSGGSSRWKVFPKNAGTRRHSSQVRKFVEEIGIAGTTSGNKRIPEKFFRASNRQIALLVSRLIDTDGWICKQSQSTAQLGYSTTSKGLAEDVVRLLLRLGVAAKFSVKRTKYKGEPYTSYAVFTNKQEELKRVLPKLSLLDKQEASDKVMGWLTEGPRKYKATHGDLVWDVIESIEYDGDGEFWTLSVDGPASYVDSSGILSHNSGKDLIARMGSLRVAYLLLCLKSPQEYFGMPPVDSIHLLNVARNAPQAKRAFFDPMRKSVGSGWFADKAHPTNNAIQYAKNIEAISGHSDTEGQEGLNLIFGVADEIDAFPVRDEIQKAGREASSSAESILELLKTSASTRFPETYKRVAISYPRYQGSPIMKLVQEGNDSIKKFGDKSIHYVSGPKATWEVNPRVKGKEQFAEDYETDPDGAAAKYECKPKKAINPYFRNMDQFRAGVVDGDQPIEVEYRLEESISELNGVKVNSWEVNFKFDPKFKPTPGAKYSIHADLAIRGDRAGVAMSHIEDYQEIESEVTDEDGYIRKVTKVEPIIRNDFVMAFEADLTLANPREIQIYWVRELVYALQRRGFWIERVSYDSFQSVDSIQLLNKRGILTTKYSLDTSEDGWRTLRDVSSTDRLRMPYSQLLFDELESLSKIGRKVDHPPKGCFVGETRIPLLDGTFPTISELSGKEVWVYSSKLDGTIVPGKARGRYTKHVTELVDVILDTGYVARCTPEHLWLLRDGTYKPAKDLRPGIDRLMPITMNWPINGGYTSVSNRDGRKTINRKVRAVETVILEEPVPVYDLEVDEWDNFALTGGVFVHNSKDLADAFAGSIVGAIEVGGNYNNSEAIVVGKRDQVQVGKGSSFESFGPNGIGGMPPSLRGFGF